MHKVSELFIGLIVIICLALVFLWEPEPNTFGYLLVHLAGLLGFIGTFCVMYDRLDKQDANDEWQIAIKRAKYAYKRHHDK